MSELKLAKVVFVIACFLRGVCHGISSKSVVKLENEHDKLTMFKEFLKMDITLEFEISPTVFIIDLGTSDDIEAERKIMSVMTLFPNKVNAMERSRIYDDTLMPGSSNTDYELPATNLVCDHYYGMGVEQVWKQGITGKGVKISILDVGVNTHLREFQHSVDEALSYNYVEDSRDVTPEYFQKISISKFQLPDHGNQIGSIITAAKGNNLCSAGIAYDSILVVRKIFTVIFEYSFQKLDPLSHWTSSDIIARAIVENVTDISVTVMAWSPVKEQHYEILDLATREAISTAAKKGRNGLGTLMFAPAGALGNGIANNIHTITVGGMSKDGGFPDSVYGDASVIVCGLTEGTNLTSSKMVTTTLGDRCVTGFRGVSAATGQVGAISALVLEANPRLSLRDVQHLFVRTSNHEGLKETPNFKQNGAGHFVHGVLGFGLANATTLVASAQTWEPVPPLHTKTFNSASETINHTNRKTFTFNYDCMETEPFCLEKLEHVEVKMKLKIKAKSLGMAIESPSGTESVIIDSSIKQTVSDDLTEVSLVSVHFWDENPIGDWKVLMKLQGTSRIEEMKIVLHGTGVENTLHKKQQRTKTLAATTSKKLTTSNKVVDLEVTTGSGANILFGNLCLLMMCLLVATFMPC